MKSPDETYYRLALAKAKAGDLTGAAVYAGFALKANPGHERAGKLLEICLGEMGYSAPVAEKVTELALMAQNYKGGRGVAGFMTRRRVKALLKDIPDGGVRILNIKGCVCAVLGDYNRAAGFFAAAFERDKGNGLAARGLAEVCGRIQGEHN